MKPDIICGLNAVAAAFARRPEAMLRLYYAASMREVAGPLCATLAAVHKPYRMMEPDELAKAAGTTHHGGIVAVAKALVPAILDPAAPPRGKLLLVLDGIANPHNLGAIARSAAFFGVPALLLGEGHGHAMPSDAALRIAEGGLEYLALYRTRDLPRALGLLTPHYRTVALTQDQAAMTLADLPRDRPVALVLGHEERGVSPDVVASCRRQVRIVGHGSVRSLNMAQAAAVLLHALSA